MAKIQTYPDVGLSAVKDIENIVFNCISQAMLLSSNKNTVPLSIMLHVTSFILLCTKVIFNKIEWKSYISVN